MPELTIKLPRDKDAQSCTMKINNERVVVASDDKKLFDPETVTVAVVVDASYRYDISLYSANFADSFLTA